MTPTALEGLSVGTSVLPVIFLTFPCLHSCRPEVPAYDGRDRRV
jgi:hypothetical protein